MRGPGLQSHVNWQTVRGSRSVGVGPAHQVKFDETVQEGAPQAAGERMTLCGPVEALTNERPGGRGVNPEVGEKASASFAEPVVDVSAITGPAVAVRLV
jgi:hypothetical protein